MYRRDIDGLRAVAVLGVLFYHADIAGFGGGYVGVDVFFVISGFLITQLIRREVTAGSFSFSAFYVRRMRRLFPAFIATLLFCLAGAFWLYAPDHFERFGSALNYSVLALSNVFFWSEAGYFDADADLKPLLHTWSLAVEEQFYLVWPMVLVLLLGLKRTWLAPAVIVAVGLVSFFLNFVFADGESRLLTFIAPWLAPSFADGQATIFFLSPFRVFEFGIGAIMVWFVSSRPNAPWFAELLTLAGLALIIMSFITYTDRIMFPYYNALAPSIGAALVIYAGGSRYAGWLLTNRIAVGVGLISYSLYLVHWPLIVFYKYWRQIELGSIELGVFDKIAIIIVSIALATASWFLIEKPFRRPQPAKKPLSGASFGLVSAGAAMVLLFTGSHIWAQHGWGWRFNALVANLPSVSEMWTARAGPVRQGACFIAKPANFAQFDKERCLALAGDKPNYLVIGDSFAADSYAVLKEAYPDVNFLQATTGNCKPIAENDGFADCAAIINDVIHEFLPGSGVDGVILSAAWAPPDMEQLDQTVEAIAGYGYKSIIMGSTVRFIKAVPTHIAESDSVHIEEIAAATSTQLRKNIKELNGVMKARYAGIANYVDYYEMLCTPICKIFTERGDQIYIDWGHLTVEGARYHGQLVRARYGYALFEDT